MFVAAVGAGGIVGIIAIANHGDHSDHYGDYSRYSDGAMLARIKEKESEVREHKAQIERLRRLAKDNLEEIIADLRDDHNLASFIPLSSDIKGDTGVAQLNNLSSQAVKRIEQALKDEIREDENELRQLDGVLQKINNLRFK